jgi:HK97 family phage major capsid protein
MGKTWDFEGWATKNDVKCADGRTIRRNAFKDDDGQVVPLVYMHDHNSPTNVLGHALLENRPEGVYCYGKFNNSKEGQHTKECVNCGDLNSLSIYARGIRQSRTGDVLHGSIKEVSVVLAGANPEAKIDTPVFAHSDDYDDDEMIIYSNEYIEPDEEYDEEVDESEEHDDTDDEEVEEEFEHADDSEEDGESIGEILSGLSEKEMKAVALYASMLADEAVAEALGENKEDVEHSEYYEGDEDTMKHNIFDVDTEETNEDMTLSHSDMESIIAGAKSTTGSLRQSFDNFCDDKFELNHAYPENPYGIMTKGNTTIGDQTYSTYGIGELFPDYKSTTNTPIFIDRPQDWVSKVMGGVKNVPFTRIKTMMADITDDEARAKGYITGTRKKEEVFTLLKRTTDPQTIYKKQKLDRDDVIDITDFDVVAWIKTEMRGKLNEEIARAILVGDGRSSSDPDKIQETHVRPIWHDASLFTILKRVSVANDADEDVVAKAFIRAAIKARKDYRGSGSPKLFTTADMLTDMLLLEDGMGRRLYNTQAELATALRVSEIVEVPVMENLATVVGEGASAKSYPLLGIIVNLTDYSVGTNKGGQISMFSDFDINFNQMIELLETRISGALTIPFSAITLELDRAAAESDGGEG